MAEKMKEIERLIEAAQDVIATRDILSDSQLVRLSEAKTAAESMLKRAKVFDGEAGEKRGKENSDFTIDFVLWAALNIPLNKRVRIIVIEEADK